MVGNIIGMYTNMWIQSLTQVIFAYGTLSVSEPFHDYKSFVEAFNVVNSALPSFVEIHCRCDRKSLPKIHSEFTDALS